MFKPDSYTEGTPPLGGGGEEILCWWRRGGVEPTLLVQLSQALDRLTTELVVALNRIEGTLERLATAVEGKGHQAGGQHYQGSGHHPEPDRAGGYLRVSATKR